MKVRIKTVLFKPSGQPPPFVFDLIPAYFQRKQQAVLFGTKNLRIHYTSLEFMASGGFA